MDVLMTFIESVAKAIYDRDPTYLPESYDNLKPAGPLYAVAWDNLYEEMGPAGPQFFLDSALDVLKAQCVPTQAMLDAANAAGWSNDCAASVWSAMIQAAIAEAGGE